MLLAVASSQPSFAECLGACVASCLQGIYPMNPQVVQAELAEDLRLSVLGTEYDHAERTIRRRWPRVRCASINRSTSFELLYRWATEGRVVLTVCPGTLHGRPHAAGRRPVILAEVPPLLGAGRTTIVDVAPGAPRQRLVSRHVLERAHLAGIRDHETIALVVYPPSAE